jgi:hypothetical protein
MYMTMNKKQAAALLMVKVAFGASLALGLSSMAHAAPSVGQVSEIEVESDGSVFVTDQAGVTRHELLENGTWRAVTEDDEQWSCVDDGNHVCGPQNDEQKPAGCYDDGGVLVAQWPCHVEDIGKGATDIVADPASPQYDIGQTYN